MKDRLPEKEIVIAMVSTKKVYVIHWFWLFTFIQTYMIWRNMNYSLKIEKQERIINLDLMDWWSLNSVEYGITTSSS